MINIKNMINIFISLIFFAMFFAMSIIVFAISEPVYASGAIGWHWYNEIIKNKNQKIPKKSLERKEFTAQEQMVELRKTVEEAKARAILFPSEQNVYTYLILQNYVVEKAEIFSRVWQKTLLDYPEVNYGVLHPTENNAQHILYAEKRERESQAIAYFRDKYGLLFFYRGNNSLDKELAPTIQSFITENHLALIPVTVDGVALGIFPQTQVDNGQAKKLGITYFPALILVDPINKIVKPLNYGFIAQDELRNRFLQVATDFREGA